MKSLIHTIGAFTTRGRLIRGTVSWPAWCLWAAMLSWTGPTVMGQNYDVGRWLMGGGGGASGGGPYALSSAIGQASVGTAAGGNYQVLAGFFEPEDAGGVSLRIERSAGAIRLSWLKSAGTFTLRRTQALDPPIPWTDIAGPYGDDGTYYYVLIPAPTANWFFQLRR
jgi:hypothetical protein